MCFCGLLCKFMKSEVLGDDYGMRFFMCENYEFDPPKRYGRDRLRYHLNRLCLCYALFDFVMILIFAGQRLLRLFVILCSGSTPSSRSRLRTMLNNKQGGLRNVGREWCKRNNKRRSTRRDQEEIRKRIEEVDHKTAAKREADRERKRERARRAKEAGPEAIRKGKYPRCTSRVVPCNPGILHSIRHGRFRCNKKLPCRVHMPLQLVVYVFS